MYIVVQVDDGSEICLNMDAIVGFCPRVNGGTGFLGDIFKDNIFLSSTPYEEVKAQAFGFGLASWQKEKE